ncbi:OsmC family protein [Rossellomorea sp. SC111]|uniref:OsmC family protein n=1 Tax=Rossellomorea sp. SC111 TaxID=2968985 RepID=UPI00215AA832|nr:OsmC family protein [Rossellomorea sp. SC111]MCR8849436.1 OsmC family protein [Rossellomorea sp. SC111]
MEYNMQEGGFYSDLVFGKLEVSGNEEYGFRPFQLLVSSVAVCSGGVLRNVLEKMRIPFDDIHIKADVTRNEDEANRVEAISLHFTIRGTDLDEAKIEKAMKLTRKNCSMVQSVQDSIKIEETFELVG